MKTLFLLKDVSDFAPGAFENTAVEDGSIQLGRSGGSYLHSGCYTSPPFRIEPFLHLVPSWNAATPHGTAVEVQVRVCADGQWSEWLSFGKWSPFIARFSPPAQENPLAAATGSLLYIHKEKHPADMVQLRIYLYSDDQLSSPKVRLLGFSVSPVRHEREESSRAERVLRLPMYSCLVRDPSLSSRIASPTTLSMLMNRWGQDTLPEEVARASYDFGAGQYGNLAFCSAIAGAYGYECHIQYGSTEVLRNEIRRGHAVGAHIQHLPNKTSSSDLSTASADSDGYLVAVCGFSRRENEEWVIFHDPMAPSNMEVLCEIPLSQFLKIYTGICLVLHKGGNGFGLDAPERLVGEVRIEDSFLRLFAKDELVPQSKFVPDGASLSTVSYTLPEGVAYASAAQKSFYYLQADEEGRICFDAAALAGKKAAFYFVGPRGQTWVAERTVPPAEVSAP